MPDLAMLLERERDVWRSVINKDAEALAQAFSYDYVEITSDGKRVLRDSIVEDSPNIDDVRSFEISQPSIIELGDDAAILSYHLVLVGNSAGHPITPEARWVVSVWRHDGRDWRCCFFQQTGIQRSPN